jgi:hypothetical protein
LRSIIANHWFLAYCVPVSAINNDHSRSSMPEKIDSGLTAENQPNKKGSVLSKGDSRYWLVEGRLFKNHGSAEYACRFTALKRREHFPLGTQNKKKAAAKAAEIYNHIHSEGWEATLRRYKSDTVARDDSSPTTVGQFIEAARHISTARSHSIDAYTKAFRKIVSDIKGIPSTSKYVARGIRHGNPTWGCELAAECRIADCAWSVGVAATAGLSLVSLLPAHPTCRGFLQTRRKHLRASASPKAKFQGFCSPCYQPS